MLQYWKKKKSRFQEAKKFVQNNWQIFRSTHSVASHDRENMCTPRVHPHTPHIRCHHTHTSVSCRLRLETPPKVSGCSTQQATAELICSSATPPTTCRGCWVATPPGWAPHTPPCCRPSSVRVSLCVCVYLLCVCFRVCVHCSCSHYCSFPPPGFCWWNRRKTSRASSFLCLPPSSHPAFPPCHLRLSVSPSLRLFSLHFGFVFSQHLPPILHYFTPVLLQPAEISPSPGRSGHR